MNTAPENNQQHEQMRESFSRMVARLIATPQGKYVVDWIEKAVLSGFIGVCGLLAGIQWATLDYKGRIDALNANAGRLATEIVRLRTELVARTDQATLEARCFDLWVAKEPLPQRCEQIIADARQQLEQD